MSRISVISLLKLIMFVPTSTIFNVLQVRVEIILFLLLYKLLVFFSLGGHGCRGLKWGIIKRKEK